MSNADSLRGLARRVAPRGARKAVEAIRKAVGTLPIDDVVLADYALSPDPEPAPRLNLAIPTVAAGSAFGGVQTGFEIVIELAKELDIAALRLIVTDPEAQTDPGLFTAAAIAAGYSADRVEVLALSSARASIPVRARDLFVAFNFWTALNLRTVIESQAAQFGRAPLPLVYLIQEYEPAFFAFSSAHLLAREAYDNVPRLWGVFNSGSLEAYFRLQGHRAERAFVFEPVIADGLRLALKRVADAPRSRRIVVYGRETVDRNCFPALVRGLRRWAGEHPEFSDWEVVSAGTPHKPFALGDGRQVRSVGKLSLGAYADLLLGSRVGVSLMASPHPSYPPLEMAHMGLVTVTNTYTCKDLSGWHANIVSTASIADAALAHTIAEACRRSETGPSANANPDFVRADKYPFLADLAAALRAEIGA